MLAQDLGARLRGDLDGNGRLEAADALLLTAALVGDAPATLALHDLDGDGHVGAGDLDALRAHLPSAARRVGSGASPASVALLPPYPNPFNAQTALVVTLPAATRAELSIHNLLGQRVRRLLDGERPAGVHRTTWDGRDESGRQTTSGLYLVVLRTPAARRVQRLLLVR